MESNIFSRLNDLQNEYLAKQVAEFWAAVNNTQFKLGNTDDNTVIFIAGRHDLKNKMHPKLVETLKDQVGKLTSKDLGEISFSKCKNKIEKEGLQSITFHFSLEI